MSTAFRFTIEDLEHMPRVEGARYELIGGELYVSTQPHWAHQFASGRVYAALDSWSRQTGAGRANVAPGLVFTREDAVAPDLVWVRRERLTAVVGSDGKLHAAPDLVVEVLSPGAANQRRDLEDKLQLYSAYEVPEYWIVDWRNRSVRVYRLAEGELRLVATLTGDDTITSPLLPGFACPLGDLWDVPG